MMPGDIDNEKPQTWAVGQRVIALHPKSREVHNGSVLTFNHDKCTIQFDRPELGVAYVKDVDCMPLNLLDNMFEALRSKSGALYRFSMNPAELRFPQQATGSLILHTSNEHLKQSPTIALMNHRRGHNVSGAPDKAAESSISQHAAYAPPPVSQIQARETDIRALSALTFSLDKKEAILTELKAVNDDLISHKNETGTDMKVTAALLNLKQRNTHPSGPEHKIGAKCWRVRCHFP